MYVIWYIMSLDTSNLFGNLLIDKGTIRTFNYHNRSWFLMLYPPLINFGTQKYQQNELKFNGVCLRNNLSKIKNGAYIINLDAY